MHLLCHTHNRNILYSINVQKFRRMNYRRNETFNCYNRNGFYNDFRLTDQDFGFLSEKNIYRNIRKSDNIPEMGI